MIPIICKICSGILVAAIFIFASCSSNRVQDKPEQETPKALTDKSSSFYIVSKRGGDDMIESLYSELTSKNADLKNLENKIDKLNSSKNDMTELFDRFDSKSRSYYRSADWHISNIKDSLLRDKMKQLIADHLKNYDSQVAKHNELLTAIETKQTTIADLHTALKIVRTLPVIEQYQKSNMPGTASLEGYVKQQDQTIKLADTLLKK